MNSFYLINRDNAYNNFSFNNFDDLSLTNEEDSVFTEILDDTDFSDKAQAIASQFLQDELLRCKKKNKNLNSSQIKKRQKNDKTQLSFILNPANLDEKIGYELNAFKTNFIKKEPFHVAVHKKGKWSKEEIIKLKEVVQQFENEPKQGKWSKIARKMDGRTNVQCFNKWHNLKI